MGSGREQRRGGPVRALVPRHREQRDLPRVHRDTHPSRWSDKDHEGHPAGVLLAKLHHKQGRLLAAGEVGATQAAAVQA